MVVIGCGKVIQEQEQERESFEIVDDTIQSPIGNYVDLAMDLVQFGYDNNSAISLVQAAAIFTAIPVGTLTLTETLQGKNAEVVTLYSYDPQVIMSDAKKMAQEDQNLLAYITSVENRMNEQLATRDESSVDVEQSTIHIASGETRIVYLFASTDLSKYRVRVRGDGTKLRMLVSSTLDEGKYKGGDEGSYPSLTFWIGHAQGIKISVTNIGYRPIDCDVILEKISDPEQMIKKVKDIIGIVLLLG